MGYGVPEFASDVRRFVNENLPGRTVKRILLVTVEDEKPFALPIVTIALPAQQSTPNGRLNGDGALSPTPCLEELASDERGRTGLHPCVRDILATLREVGRPLSKTRLVEEMDRRSREWGETTVARFLKILMDDGTLENPPDSRPRGYRIADETGTSDE